MWPKMGNREKLGNFQISQSFDLESLQSLHS